MVNKKAIIVVGLGYGDEGKGLTTDYLCLINKNSLVVRFNGGHQAGHCVVTKEGKKHIFSNFGAGSMRNIPTYWSSYCTVEPAYFIEEYNSMDFEPKIYIDNNCPVTTHYDVLYNRSSESSRGKSKFGSCGVGFGATIERQKIREISLQFKDILEPDTLIKKLKLIKEYYRNKINTETIYDFDSFSHDLEDHFFIDCVKKMSNLISKGIIIPSQGKDIFNAKVEWDTFIFEGAQGILLDKDHGTKPFITKSNTTSRNALIILDRQKEFNFSKEIFYVTRAYQTRHGAGPFRNKDPEFLLNNFDETNFKNEYQGEFKYNYLDVDLLNFALDCDSHFSIDIPKNLMITCIDQLESKEIVYYKNGKKEKGLYNEIAKVLSCNFKTIKYSFSNCAEFIQ